jgi:hypothetical protein
MPVAWGWISSNGTAHSHVGVESSSKRGTGLYDIMLQVPVTDMVVIVTPAAGYKHWSDGDVGSTMPVSTGVAVANAEIGSTLPPNSFTVSTYLSHTNSKGEYPLRGNFDVADIAFHFIIFGVPTPGPVQHPL